MSGIIINKELCIGCGVCISSCPFNALEMVDGKVEVNANCKVCKICINQCPVNAITFEEVTDSVVDKDAYRDILVFVEHEGGKIHPVTLELIGKAREMAAVINQEVNCIFIGSNIHHEAQLLLEYGVARVFVYDNQALEHFRVDNYANMFADCINKAFPVCVLVGATAVGRSLAPRVATRFKAGLTADCTVLEMRENTDLVQIRPAFGGDIMAQILTTHTRPQFATVRYQVMDMAHKVENPHGELIVCEVDAEKIKSDIEIQAVSAKEAQLDISAAERIVVAGNGVKDEFGYQLVCELAKALDASIAVTRPLMEKGFADYLHQIGLSGRTVKPKLIICCGVSGSIQFTSGMKNSEVIMAINNDPEAPIFKIAHHAMVGDLFEIIPELLQKIKGEN